MSFLHRTIVLLIFLLPGILSAQISLTFNDHRVYTPNSSDTIGAFARIFQPPSRPNFYLVYAARPAGYPFPKGRLKEFRWLELDPLLNPTGTQGTLSHLPSGAGDFAMVQADSFYFHLTVYTGGDYVLTKYDLDFNWVDSTLIYLDPCESNIDQLMNYTRNRLVIGAMYDPVICPPVNPPSPSLMPYSHIYQYDLNLNSVTAPVLLSTPSKITWGASMIYQDDMYQEVTMNNFLARDLRVFQYDSNLNYLGSKLLDNDGQWSQGVLFDGTYYFVAYHTKDHNRGNVKLKVFDQNWDSVFTTMITNYPIGIASGDTSRNANRPFLLRSGTRLYVSYDVETYTYPENHLDWQSHITVYDIHLPTQISSVQEHLPAIHVYPNPVQDNIVIEYSGTPVRLTLTEAGGKTIRDFVISEKVTMDLSGLPSGYYILTAPELHWSAPVAVK